ncbi:MAG: polyphosphate kinase 1 [Acidimicrobiales bacterium]
MDAPAIAHLLNRELSWLDFDARVLALAADAAIPLLERVKFAAIFSNNLDEFFQVRVAALKDQEAAGYVRPSPDGRSAAQQLGAISAAVADLVDRQESIVLDELLPALFGVGIELRRWSDLDPADRAHLVQLFEQRVFPVLTPLAVDPAHPFPYISNLSLNLGVTVVDPNGGERRFARVKVPRLLPRFVQLPGTLRFVPLEDLIAAHLSSLFPGMDVTDCWTFRVTRNSDLTLDDEEEADDLLAAVEMELRRRRFGRAVRLEVAAGMPAAMRELLVRELDLRNEDVSLHRAPLDLTGLFQFHGLDRPDLKDEAWPPVTAPPFQEALDGERSMFAVLRERDVLVHHPYESFADSVEQFIEAAADDPRVLTIKMTLYRAGANSPILGALMRAAERGVQVVALVELKARFDEQANIAWARALERAGVHVMFGQVGLKTHAKCILVVRDDADGIRRYCHIGTGNYNSSTARIYEDVGLLTSDPEIGADLGQLFNHLTGFSRELPYDRLVVAPGQLRPRLEDLIAREASFGANGSIRAKMNSLVDPGMIEALYGASRAGVRIELTVRGICCLRAGVPGLSENVMVRSLVGRYLEHSRIYRFGNGSGAGEPKYLIGSADLMPRNLDRRVEVLVEVRGASAHRRLDEILDLVRADRSLAWELRADDRWYRQAEPGGLDSQQVLYERAWARARRNE